jgi:hypothetical protein
MSVIQKNSGFVLKLGIAMVYVAPCIGQTVDKSLIPSAGDAIKIGDRVGLKADAAIFSSMRKVGDVQEARTFCAPYYTIFAIDRVEAVPSKIKAETTDGKEIDTNVTTTKDGTTTTNIKGANVVSQTTTDATLHVHIKWSGARKAKDGETRKDSTWKISNALSNLGIGVGAKHVIYSDDHCDGRTVDTNGSGTDSVGLVAEHNEYTTTVSQLSNYGLYRNGLTWGALAIPYKYEFSDHSFQAKPSVAAYVGYESWLGGLSVAGVFAAGAGGSSQSGQSTPPATGGNGSTTPTVSGAGTQALYTLGTGVIFTLGGAFKGGILFGKDWAGSGSGFKYEGHTWMAVTLGAGF